MENWEASVLKVTPYTPGEQPDETAMIKLNTNENPYPPSPLVKAAISEIPEDSFRLYPDPAATALVKKISKVYEVHPEQVFVGVGSDDVLALAFLTFFHSDKPVLFPEISYSFYPVWASLFGIPYKTVPLNDALELEPSAPCKENGGIVFPNPNAPTGCALSLTAVEEIVRNNPDVVVIVDEAYVDFGAESALPLIHSYDNLLVVQTFSKSRSMAGARIGFACGNEKLIRYLSDVKYSFNSYTMSRMAIAAGVASLTDQAYFRAQCEKIIATRERAKKRFTALGFTFPDSKANFIFVKHQAVPATELFAALREQKIFVRHFNQPGIENYLRITIGTDEEMEKLFSFLERYLGQGEGKHGQ